MSISPRKPSQFELFPSSDHRSSEAVQIVRIPQKIVLNHEKSIVLVIVIIMLGVLFYSLGVERGRRIIAENLVVPVPAEKINVGQIKINDIMEPVSEAKKEAPVKVRMVTDEPQEASGSKEEVLEIPEEFRRMVESAYTVQVASFKTQHSANKEAVSIKSKGFESFVVDKGKYSIVCVGKFENQSEAKEFSKRLKNRYNDLIVRRL